MGKCMILFKMIVWASVVLRIKGYVGVYHQEVLAVVQVRHKGVWGWGGSSRDLVE